MGYIVLASQLRAINSITNNGSVNINSVSINEIDSINLLWLPGYIQLTVWDNKGQHSSYKISEDGKVETNV